MVEALAAAGETAGLSAPAARELSRQALIGAAGMLKASGEEASTLRARIASPGGTTEAGLAALTGGGALHELMNRTVAAAAARSRQLGGEA
jgi:pyrroline-5-carboxylate reductase